LRDRLIRNFRRKNARLDPATDFWHRNPNVEYKLIAPTSRQAEILSAYMALSASKNALPVGKHWRCRY
jgi:hypothetical protein